jgi:NAD(P)-dependent dehydrogenase (short-subunit alcohol dehydrogenase family)
MPRAVVSADTKTSNGGDAVNDLDGLVAVVTGGAAGIGLTTASTLHARGAAVACLDIRPETVPDPLVGVACDVADDRSVQAAISTVVNQFQGLDVVVNNAGIGAVGTVADNQDQEWLRVLDVNVVGMARVSRAALPHLRRSSAASIVNTCSFAATLGLPNRALYSASKGAVLALTLAMAADHVREGIRVNCVSPGSVATAWVDRLVALADDPDAELRALRDRQPIGRLVTPLEVAHAIAYLASPLSGSTTGTVLAVDGGAHALRLRAGGGAPL